MLFWFYIYIYINKFQFYNKFININIKNLYLKEKNIFVRVVSTQKAL
jgi:hypothetical protein